MAVVAKHLAIAETLRETEIELSDHRSEDMRASATAAWSDMWKQLQEARAIAVQYSRDVSAYDAAYAHSKTYLLDPIQGYVLSRVAREAAEDAIDSLRAAFPEIVVPGRPRGPRSPRPVFTQPAFKILVKMPRSPTDANDKKIQKYQVSLRSPGYSDFSPMLSRYDSAPIGRFVPRCVCCNTETEYAFDYIPVTPPRVVASRLRVPRCRDCADHIAQGNAGEWAIPIIFGIFFVSCVLAFLAHPLYGVGAVACVIGLVAFDIRARMRERRHFQRGHCTRFAVFIGPKLFRLSTSNRTLLHEFVELNRKVGDPDRNNKSDAEGPVPF